MKKILLSILSLFLLSCEDVIDVDLNTEKPRLVIDASINWKKGTLGNEQVIKLSTTTGFYDTEIPKVSNAVVTVTDSQNRVFNFVEGTTLGTYKCTDFMAVLNETYALKITSGGQTYIATEKLYPVASINKIEQEIQNDFAGKSYQFKTFYNDPSGVENYYMYKYADNISQTFYYVDKDEFFNGNLFFSVYRNEKVKVNDTVNITHFGISKTYYNYMNIVLDIAGNSGGGPFQSPPVSVKGNIINQTDAANYALGYFRLSETDTISLLVQ